MTISRTDFLEKELDRLLKWITAAESRLAFILSLSTAMLGAMAVFAPSLGELPSFPATLATLAFGLLCISIGCSAAATFPRTKGSEPSLVYFGAISRVTIDEFAKAIEFLSEDEYVRDLTRQCHRNAVIATTKFIWIRRSIACTLAASLPWSISIHAAYLG